MMTYKEIFKEIVEIMREDSATCKDYGAGNFQEYESRISDDMDRKDFLHLVQEYLATFGVEAHLYFTDYSLEKIGFSVMRQEDVLYVLKANEDTGLVLGDKIVAIDGFSIKELYQREKAFFMGETEEREGKNWPYVLKFYNSLTVIHPDGSQEDISIIHNTKRIETESYCYKEYDDTLYLKFPDFADLDAINQLFNKCKSILENCKKLIVDVRGNGGGADSAFVPLLEYCFPEGKLVTDYYKPEYPIEINYSVRNCKDRIENLKQFLAGDLPEDMTAMINTMITNNNENIGKGFLDDDDVFASGIIGKKGPEKVLIITDERCGSSGDAFVEVMSCSPKVTLVGRPTMGITDYSNCNMVSFDDFSFIYPTSRDNRIDHGKGLAHKGVPVDHYIPWSPEHIGKDVELDYCLKLN
ncbi:MAG: peptidase S41 [Butyrivibrio sp.]|nr:peptidase S41 [Butyrivibrio sp.]